MSILIVGHGPSMLESALHDKINSFDCVIRQKRIGIEMTKTHPENFGTKTDIVCGSATIREQLVADCEKWVFFDSRHTNWNPEAMGNYKMNKPLCDLWNGLYRSMRTNELKKDARVVSGRTSDTKGHTHMSAGLHTIIYTCAFLKPDKITLVGFDNVRSGEFTWSVTRGKNWAEYPDHRWDIESKLLKYVSILYNIDIEHLE